MPELPEVETIRRGLMRRVLNKRIAKVEVRKRKVVRGQPRVFVQRLQGKTFTAIRRRGKLLIFSVAGGEEYLLVHLKMTGQLIYQEGDRVVAGGHGWPRVENNLPNKYSHVIFHFRDGSRLYFNDLRQFGFLAVVNEAGRQAALARFGLEPMSRSFTWEKFRERVAGRAGSLKAVLLNQAVVAGIGNIYADEICFQVRVRPDRSVRSLSEQELRVVWRACRQVMERALKYGGTTFRHFRDADGRKGNFTQLLKVYGRGGQACRRCGATLVRQKVAQRGTTYCLSCQR